MIPAAPGATAEEPDPADGFAILAWARHGTLDDGTLTLRPENGSYVFDVEVYDDAGDPVPVGEVAYGFLSVDALEDGDADPGNASSEDLWLVQRTATNADGDHAFTARVPTAGLGFGSTFPANGVAFFVVLHEAPDGASFRFDNGSFPAGSYSLTARSAAAAGDWDDADRLDRQWTPILAGTTDTDDLVEAGQPLLNPDMSTGLIAGLDATDALDPSGSTGDQMFKPAAAVPWFLLVDRPGVWPASTSEVAPVVDGGNALRVHAAEADVHRDDGGRLWLGQWFAEPQRIVDEAGGARSRDFVLNWTDADAVEARVRVSGGVTDVTLSLEWVPASSGRVTESTTVEVAPGDGWTTVDLDVSGLHPGRPLWRAWLGLAGADGTSSGDLTVDVDHVRILNATFQPVRIGSDLADTYAVHVEPFDPDRLDPDTGGVVADPLRTVGGERYLFDVRIWDTVEDGLVDHDELLDGLLQVGRADARSVGVPDTWTDRFNGPVDGYDAGTEVVASPDGEVAYVAATSEGNETGRDILVRAMDVLTGDTLWSTRWDGADHGFDVPLAAQTSADGATLFLAGWSEARATWLDYIVLAVDTATGDVLWSTRHDGGSSDFDVARELAVGHDGTVYVAGRTTHVSSPNSFKDRRGDTLALDPATGEVLWSRQLPDRVWALAASPTDALVHAVIIGRNVTNSNADFRTVAMDGATGDVLWTRHFNPDGTSDFPTAAAYAPDGSRLFVAGQSADPVVFSPDFAAVAYDPATGDEAWTYKAFRGGGDVPEALAVSPDGSRLFLTGEGSDSTTTQDGLTVALDAATGDELWARFFRGPALPFFDTSFDSTGFDRNLDVGVSGDGDRVHVTGYGYENGNAPGARIHTVTYDAATGQDEWLAIADPSPAAWDAPSALAVAGDHVVVAGWTEREPGDTFFTDVGPEPDVLTVAYPSASGGYDRFASTREVYPRADGRGVVAVVRSQDVHPGTSTDVWFGTMLPDRTGGPTGQTLAAGHLSLLKDHLEGLAVADQLDGAPTPVTFSGVASSDFRFDFAIQDLVQDGDDVVVEVAGSAPVLEPARVSLTVGSDVRTATTDDGVGRGHASSVRFPNVTLPTTGVELAVLDGEFHRGTTVEIGPPVLGPVDVVSSDGGPVTDGVAARLHPGSFADADLSPCIVEAAWTLEEPSKGLDATIPVQDADDDGCLIAADATVDHRFADDGSWDVTLTARDDEGETRTTSATVTVANALPVLSDPAVLVDGESADGFLDVPPGRLVEVRSAATDASPTGILLGEVHIESLGTVGVPDPDDPEAYTLGTFDRTWSLVDSSARVALPSPGEYLLTVRWTDDDGGAASASTTLNATEPSYDIGYLIARAVNGTHIVGPSPVLVGETASVSVGVRTEGDRVTGADLVVLGPDGAEVARSDAPQTTDLFAQATAARVNHGVRFDPGQAGTYVVAVEGTSFLGTDLAGIGTASFEVRESRSPVVDLDPSVPAADDGKIYLEVGETLVLDAAVDDPDCPGHGPRCDVDLAWDLDGDGAFDDGSDGTVEIAAAQGSPEADGRTVHLRAVDHVGKVTVSSLTYVVDDHLALAREEVPAADRTETLSDGSTVHVVSDPAAPLADLDAELRVADDLGDPVDGRFLWDVRYSPQSDLVDLGAYLTVDGAETAQAFANGTLTVPVGQALAETGNAPGMYVVRVQMNSDPGRIDRPDQGPVEESLTVEVHVWVGPWTGTVEEGVL